MKLEVRLVRLEVRLGDAADGWLRLVRLEVRLEVGG